MDKAAEALLIIVSSVLSIFLLLCIVAGFKIVQLLNSLKRIAEKAESIADSAEAVGDFFRKSAGPIAFSRFIANIGEAVMHHKKSK